MNLAIIQARMGSTRLPGKILKKINDETVIWNVVDRVKRVPSIDLTVVATTLSAKDDILVDYLKSTEICEVFRGSELDVLKRFYDCAVHYDADVVIRVTADDPLKDPEVIERAINALIENDFDYCSNTMIPTYPEGLDIEVFSFNALSDAFSNAKLESEREHVTPYIWKNPSLFKLFNFKFTEDVSHFRLTLDNEDDLKLIKIIYDKLYVSGSVFPFSEVLDYLRASPHLLKLNDATARNEGYFKSIKNDNYE